MIGTIKTVIVDKDFGFIQCDELDMDVFFHKSNCSDFDNIIKGQTVDFDFIAEKRGLRATDIRPIRTSEKLTPLNKFVMVKSGTPSDIRSLTGSVEIKSNWYRSPEDARNCIRRKAIDMGFNVLTFLECERRTVTLDGTTGYKGTEHRYSGMGLVGMRSGKVAFNEVLEAKNRELKSSAMLKAQNAESAMLKAQNTECEQKRRKTKGDIEEIKNISIGVAFFLFAAFLIFMILR